MKRLLVVFVALWWAFPALAARVDLDVKADGLEVGQSADVIVRVVDGTPTAVPRMEVPEGLEIAYVDSRTVTARVVDGHGSRNMRRVDYRFRVTALREGSWTLGPARVEMGTEEAVTGAATVEVREPAPEARPPIEVTAGFDVDRVWEGEVVLYRYRLASRLKIAGSRWTLPTFEGLVAPRDGDRPRKQYKVDDPDGVVLFDETWVPLVATGAGKRDYAGAVAQVELPIEGEKRSRFEPFGLYRTRSEIVATGPDALEIVALPPPPAGFSGLVGDFAFHAEVDRERVPVGGSVEWTIYVTGDGTLEGFSLPAAPDTVGARTYDDSPAVSARVLDGAYEATGAFHRIVVPTQEGALALPPLQIVTFSPSTGAYMTHRVEVPPLQVLPGAEGDAAVSSFAPTDADPIAPTEPEDIRDIREGGADHTIRLGPFLPVLLGATALPAVLLFGIEAVGLALVPLRRRRAPRPITPRERLDRLPSDPRDRLAALDGALRDALARRAGVPVGALVREGVIDTLPEALQARVRELTEALDRARFAEAGGAPDLEHRVRDVVVDLEAA